MMYAYQAFGMLIQSEFPLPLTKNKPGQVVPGTSDSLYQVSVKKGKVPLRDSSLSPVSCLPSPIYSLGTIRYAVSPGQIQLRIPRTGTFLVENMAAITVDPHPGTDVQTIALCLTVVVLPFLLRREPVITLHGSAAVYPGGRGTGEPGDFLNEMKSSAAIFIGTKGAGKSTTAAALTKSGWKLLCDDLVPVGPGPNVLPGIPLAKLLPDAFRVFIGNPEAAAHLFDGVNKYHADIPVTHRAAKLRTLYILQTGSVSSVHIKPLTGQEKTREIIARVIRIDGLDEPAAIFQRVTKYFGSVRAYRIIRPENPGSPSQIAEAILGLENSIHPI